MTSEFLKKINSTTIVKKIHKKTCPNTTIHSLPHDILVNVVSLLASDSLKDLCNVKLCCKDFYKTSEDKYVYQSASWQELPWEHEEGASKYFNRCKESGNLDALYLQGVFDYFSKNRTDVGIKNLEKAANVGHVDATYVYGLFLLCGDGDDQARKQEGLRLLSNCFNSKLMIQHCRKRVVRVRGSSWINNRFIHKEETGINCGKNTGEIEQNLNLWLDDKNLITCCKTCMWEYEAHLFCNT